MVGEGPVVVLLVAVRLGEPRHVHPVPGEAFAVMRGGQQAIDEPLVGVGGRVVDEGVDLLGRRGQSGQVEGDAADQRASVGDRVRLQTATLERGEDEPIDRRAIPRRVLHRRVAGQPSSGRNDQKFAVGLGRGLRPCAPRLARSTSGRSYGAPRSIHRAMSAIVASGSFARLLGHVRLLFVPDQRGEPALLAAAFEHAALDQRLAVREVEPALGRLAAVAIEAVLDAGTGGPSP